MPASASTSSSISSPEYIVFPLSGSSSSYSNAGLDQDGNPIRKRRKHLKSRAGCESCKIRKVKCDETQPACNNCMTRAFTCQYPDLRKKKSLPLRQTTRPLLPTSKASKTPTILSRSSKDVPQRVLTPEAELPNMNLLHHFISYTSPTLLFGPQIWRDGIIPLALQKNDFLLQAVFLMASAHLRCLQPGNGKLRTTEIRHLCSTMTAFRTALSGPIKETQDAMIACSLLILHHSWADTEASSQDDDGPSENLFPLAAGLRHIILSTWEIRDRSILHDVVCFKSLNPFPNRYQNAARLSDLTRFFEMLMDLDSQIHLKESARLDYLRASGRLSTVMSLNLDEPQIETKSRSISLDVARYFFLWPAMCPDGFRELVEQNYESAQLMMLCFYTAVCNMLPVEFWWMKQKAATMCRHLVSKFGAERIDDVRQASENCGLLNIYSRTIGSIATPF